MPYPVLSATYIISSSYATGVDTFHLEGSLVDDTGAYSASNVAIGDVVALDLSSYQASLIGKYKVLAADATDQFTLMLEVQWDDTVQEVVDPFYATGVTSLIYRPTPNLKLSADHAFSPPSVRAALQNADYWEKLDYPAATTGGFAVWAPATEYQAGQLVSYRGITMRVEVAHTSSASFALDLPFWSAVDNTAKVRYLVNHGLSPLTPVYLTTTGFLPARADSLGTLATHVLLDVSPNHVLMANAGDYYFPAHGLTGVLYVSPLDSGQVVAVEPDPSQYYINPVLIIEEPDWVTVVASQPAYKK